MAYNKIKIAREVLKLEADALYNLVKHIGEEFENAIQLIIERKGRVLVIGLGKSGHVGRKIAATLASTGQPSFFIHATEAAHGDLGMITSDDTCVMISHSGNTKELLEMIPALKRFGVPIISITGNPNSKLANLSEVVLNTYVNQEACPYNLAPTTSSPKTTMSRSASSPRSSFLRATAAKSRVTIAWTGFSNQEDVKQMVRELISLFCHSTSFWCPAHCSVTWCFLSEGNVSVVRSPNI